ncbi:uncharacterized protein N7503_005103 [Penicillium pulvis]|uniref:uncharacterized protein n=1 Tax=Penicillium pulvis TaxID=1562058 RepID=UPI00254754B8|nr:uncharacterized protein N7503_005103 [Penicillium pulvis]KAJ5802653.1 hypothetical protein N7503_005103 [Penicillium pulvis]
MIPDAEMAFDAQEGSLLISWWTMQIFGDIKGAAEDILRLEQDLARGSTVPQTEPTPKENSMQIVQRIP